MFDVFYSGTKPNLFAHEQRADTIDHARELSATRYFWWTNYLTDYKSHDFLWEPVPWESEHVHVWPSQWQDNGGTLLCPKNNATDCNYNHPQLKRNKSVPIVGIDHGNGIKFDCDYTTRYISDYLGTLRRILSKITEEYVWVASSVCDYSQFDWTWHPSEWQLNMLHVFASNEQKFGDTFYIHVPSFLEKSRDLRILEWFETLHFVEDISVPRLKVPQIKYSADTVVDTIWNYEFREPVVHLYRDNLADNIPAVNLWQTSTRTIVSLTADNSQAVVPRDAKNYLRTQVYDYPYIDKTYRKSIASELQDIVFISYDEPAANRNWQILSDRFPRAKRVNGVKGMEQALEAAADASTTPWYFAVFAKTQLYDAFDFTFVPDYFQQPKHYIFNSRNTVNGLEYGHMGIVMYNCAGIKSINKSGTFGLDYTMSFPNETIPVLSCIGAFDSTAYHTWRTAFREAGKLAYFESVKSTVDGAYRLDVWLTRAQGPYRDWCLKGARDGVDFVKNNNYDLTIIRQAFEWTWLREYFVARYGNLE